MVQEESVPPTDDSGAHANSAAGIESQNALLKQLLQNTGCASTTQLPQDPSGFSLNLPGMPGRSANTTSHLSEAATRIPQPTPLIRLPEAAAPASRKSPPLVSLPRLEPEPTPTVEADATTKAVDFPTTTATSVNEEIAAPIPTEEINGPEESGPMLAECSVNAAADALLTSTIMSMCCLIST